MIQINYRNNLEDCVDCFIYTITSSDRYKRSLGRKSYLLAFLFLICSLFCLDSYLGIKEKGQSSLLMGTILAGSLLLMVLSLTYFRVYYKDRSKKKMKAKMANASDSFSKDLFLKISDEELTVGSEKKFKSYPITYVEKYFDYNNHFCIILENGAVIVVPDKYFKSSDEKKELVNKLQTYQS